MTSLSKKLAFLYGCAGSLLPELLRFSKEAATQVIAAPPSGWTVYLVLIALAGADAGLVAIAWKPDSEWKALWVGASFPVIIQTLAAAPPTHT